MKAGVEAIEKGEGTTLFLVVEGEVQGICGISRNLRSGAHVGTLVLSLDHSVRGKGLGQTLMEETLEDASRIKGLRTVVLTVKSPNDVALSLYKKLGFEEFGMLPGGTKHRDEYVDEIYMYKNIYE